MSNDANSDSSSQIKFPKFYIKANEPNMLGQRVTITILRYENQEGCYSECFRCRKKKTFIENDLRVLFHEYGPLSE